MTKDEVREWLFTNYLRRNDETERTVECILSQDDVLLGLDVQQERYRGQIEDPGNAAQITEADEFAITALYECHEGPHLPTCPMKGES